MEKGNRFGRWTLITPTIHKQKKAWMCICECGTERPVIVNDLLNGKSSSCGCKGREGLSLANKRHGLHDHPLYRIWKDIKRRCLNSNRRSYRYYGGRGIKICEEWMHSFQNFYDWCLTNGYSEGLEIDRKDTNGNYEPSNCRFVTSKQNNNNRRNNRRLTINGETKTLSEWSDISGISRMTISSRIKKLGWNISDVLKPARKKVKTKGIGQ